MQTDQAENKIELWLSKHSLIILIVVFVAAISALVIIGSIYYMHFGSISENNQKWGEFGDYFGGTLNPIFGFLTVIALLVTLAIQSRELGISSRELRNSAVALEAQNRAIEHQNFEQTFFSWLQGYREILDSIEATITRTQWAGRQVDTESEIVNGRKALRYLWSRWISEDSIAATARELGNATSQGIPNAVMANYDELYAENIIFLDNLFRVLYRLILWIDSKDEAKLNIESKWLYVSIIRAQLSSIEMAYLFLNGLTERGRKFRPLIEKYALFDNLSVESIYAINHLQNVHPYKVQYNATAFSSDLARGELDKAN